MAAAPTAIRAPAQRAVLSVLLRTSAAAGSNEVGQLICILAHPTPANRMPISVLRATRIRVEIGGHCTSYKYPSTLQARSTAQVLEAAQEDRRSTDARTLLDSVEASLRQQPSGPTKVRFDRITPNLVPRRAARPSATLCVSCCPNPGARGSQTRLCHRNAASHMSRVCSASGLARRIPRLQVPRQQAKFVSYARLSRMAPQRRLEARQTRCERFEAGLECPLSPVARSTAQICQEYAEWLKACMHDALLAVLGVVPSM